MRRTVPALALLLVAACSTGGSGPAVSTGVPGPPPAVPPAGATGPAPITPAVQVQEVATGLEHVWDIGLLPDGSALVTERPGRIRLLAGTGPGAAVSDVAADLGDVHVRGEGGLMGLLVHPDFPQTRRFTTCQTHQEGGTPVDVRLVTWELSPRWRGGPPGHGPARRRAAAQPVRTALGVPAGRRGRRAGGRGWCGRSSR